MRLKFPANYEIPAHSHPTDENVAVVSGNLFMGMGDKLNKAARWHSAPAATRWCPPTSNHFAFTKAETTIVLYGIGPVEFKYVNPADDPRGDEEPGAGTVTSERRLMCVLAHPDDESLGTGGTLAKCASEGVATYVVTATRGERGRFGDAGVAGPDVVGRAREAELLAAAGELGVREVRFLDYPDGALDRVDPAEAIEKIAGHLRRVQPQVVVTFGPDGAYGHPDHIAISQLTTPRRASARAAESRRTACRSSTTLRGARSDGARIRRR